WPGPPKELRRHLAGVEEPRERAERVVEAQHRRGPVRAGRDLGVVRLGEVDVRPQALADRPIGEAAGRSEPQPDRRGAAAPLRGARQVLQIRRRERRKELLPGVLGGPNLAEDVVEIALVGDGIAEPGDRLLLLASEDEEAEVAADEDRPWRCDHAEVM